MSGFTIQFISDPFPDEECEEYLCRGRISIGSFHEEFLSSLSFWRMEDYQVHWHNAIVRILHSPVSCLITSMYDPSVANFIQWWLLYQINGKIHIQNQFLFLDPIPGKFDVYNPFTHIPERKIYTDENIRISEWICSLEDMEQYLSQKQKK